MTVTHITPDHRDQLATDAVPTAAGLAVAVEMHDGDRIAEILTPLTRQELYALAVVLAAHVDVDRPFADSYSPARLISRAVERSAKLFDCETTEVLSTSRSRHVIEARQVAMTVARLGGLSSPEIGRHFERDHATVLHAESKVRANARLTAAAMRVAAEVLGDRTPWTEERSA